MTHQTPKPTATGSGHVLPFLALEPATFERLCLWLVRAEGYDRAEHYGLGGGDHGRDIVASKTHDGAPQRWYFQCKRSPRTRIAELKAEINKVLSLAPVGDEAAPKGVVFMVAGAVSAVQRDGVRGYAHTVGLECVFWARTELDALVKSHPAVLSEFFDAGRAVTSSEDLSAMAEAALAEGLECSMNGRYDAAVQLFEEAVVRAKRAADAPLEGYARLQAARGIGMLASARSRTDPRWLALRDRIREHIEAAEAVGARPVAVAYEKALSAKLGDDPLDALDRAREAMTLALLEGGEKHRPETIGLFLQASWATDQVVDLAALSDVVATTLESLPSDMSALMLEATWLRTKCKAGVASAFDVADFVRRAKVSAGVGTTAWHRSPERAVVVVGEVAGEFHRAGAQSEALALCELGCELAETGDSPAMFCEVAGQAAELAAEMGDASAARHFLERAEAALDGGGVRQSPDDGLEWDTLRAQALRTRGRVLLRLSEDRADPEAPTNLRDGAVALQSVLDLDERNRIQFREPGQRRAFATGVRWELGQARWELGDVHEATTLSVKIR